MVYGSSLTHTPNYFTRARTVASLWFNVSNHVTNTSTVSTPNYIPLALLQRTPHQYLCHCYCSHRHYYRHHQHTALTPLRLASPHTTLMLPVSLFPMFYCYLYQYLYFNLTKKIEDKHNEQRVRQNHLTDFSVNVIWKQKLETKMTIKRSIKTACLANSLM